MHDFSLMLAAFTAPINIHTDWVSMLYMFPLLAAITIIYKATKMRVLFWKQLAVESLILFLVVSGVMIGAIIVLNLITWLVTS
ncbi:MAG: hypothetical protein H8E62_06895 [Planctomycetes bacterium]|nr:hypothetical protein [Planctomycetota bacterium]